MIKIKLSTIMGDKLIKITKLAEITGISRTTITNLYYRRSQQISLEVLDKLCKALDCELSDILEFKKEIENERI